MSEIRKTITSEQKIAELQAENAELIAVIEDLMAPHTSLNNVEARALAAVAKAKQVSPF